MDVDDPPTPAAHPHAPPTDRAASGMVQRTPCSTSQGRLCALLEVKLEAGRIFSLQLPIRLHERQIDDAQAGVFAYGRPNFLDVSGAGILDADDVLA